LLSVQSFDVLSTERKGSLIKMSYQPLHVDNEHDDVPDGVSQTANVLSRQTAPERRVFRSSNALHTAISVAAGTVMTLFGYEVRDTCSRRAATTDADMCGSKESLEASLSVMTFLNTLIIPRRQCRAL